MHCSKCRLACCDDCLLDESDDEVEVFGAKRKTPRRRRGKVCPSCMQGSDGKLADCICCQAPIFTTRSSSRHSFVCKSIHCTKCANAVCDTCLRHRDDEQLCVLCFQGKPTPVRPVAKPLKAVKKRSKKLPKEKAEEEDEDAQMKLCDGEDEDAEEDEQYVVEAVITHRKLDGKVEFKVRWKGYTAEDDTWEPFDSFFTFNEAGGRQVTGALESYRKAHKIALPPAQPAKTPLPVWN